MSARRAVAVVADTTPEAVFQQHLLFRLNQLSSLRCWRQNTGECLVRDARGRPLRVFRAGPPNGAADISGVVNDGRRLEIEVKSSGGRRSQAQIAWAAFMQRMHAVYVCVTYDDNASLDDNLAAAVADVVNAIAPTTPCLGTPGAASFGRCEKQRGHVGSCTHDPGGGA